MQVDSDAVEMDEIQSSYDAEEIDELHGDSDSEEAYDSDLMDTRLGVSEMLSPSAVKIGPAPGHKPVPFKKFDLTGQLLQNQGHPFVQDLAQTWAGRGALKTEHLYGKEGKLFMTNGTGSFYDSHSNTISIGLGQRFGISEQFAQKRLIHEQTHRWLAQTGQTADPLQYKQAEDYVKFMLLEEAEAEGNAIDHVMQLNPNGLWSASEAIYVQAYRKGYDDLKTMMLWATEEQLTAEGRKRGKEALFQAFKNGALAPSIGKYKTYNKYYEMQWRAAWKRQETFEISPAPDAEALENPNAPKSRQSASMTLPQPGTLAAKIQTILGTLRLNTVLNMGKHSDQKRRSRSSWIKLVMKN